MSTAASLTRVRKLLSKHKVHVAIVFSYLILAGVLGWLLIHDWRLETTSDLSCWAHLSDIPYDENQYVQIQLEKQDPDEPSFEGNIFINLGRRSGNSPLTVQLDTSQGRNYADNTDFLDFVYDQTNKTLRMRNRAPFDLIQTSGSHKLFPFDSAPFDFSLSFKPQIPLSLIMIENRSRGFFWTAGT
jgi:hypothetical protein